MSKKSQLFLVISMILLGFFIARGDGQALEVGFYETVCPNAESIVRDTVREAVDFDPTNTAILLRLHFHDCFVEGCDGSILIRENRSDVEHLANGHQGVGGLDVIEKAKQRLEDACSGVVSCADIVALAARDALVLAKGPNYEVPTGRRDGRVSNLTLAVDMPDVNDSIQQLIGKFSRKGLTPKDLALLSAAHSIGTTACFFMMERLYNFFPNGGGGSDPAISPAFLPELKARCPQNGDVNVRLPIDRVTAGTFDKQIFRNIRDGFAVLQSDARLTDDIRTKIVIDSYFPFFNPLFGPSFENDFAEAMIKMGQIGVKTGSDGEIRRVCISIHEKRRPGASS